MQTLAESNHAINKQVEEDARRLCRDARWECLRPYDSHEVSIDPAQYPTEFIDDKTRYHGLTPWPGMLRRRQGSSRGSSCLAIHEFGCEAFELQRIVSRVL